MVHAEETKPYLKYVDQITKEFEHEIVDEFDLVGIGSGGKMPHDVQEISVSFIAYRRATIEQARVLEVTAIEKLLKKINENEKIRPFLREHPFKADRVDVSIAFCKDDNSRYDDGSVAHVFQSRNRLMYTAQERATAKRVLLLEEPYEEALRLIKK
ncbi:MAG: hypothetical protein ACHQT8_06120 [Chlamydiales bacterium]